MTRRFGLAGATGIGVGAIVGGGILALAGATLAATGPAAIAAFALNGVIALLTAISFAEMASKFPESGGTYTFSKKVLSVEAAFTVGWVVWFASIVAAALYAIGFSYFAVLIASDICGPCDGDASGWTSNPALLTSVAIGTTLLIAAQLMFQSASSGHWINIAKVVVFGALIAGGLWAVVRQPVGDTRSMLTPFVAHGWHGLFQAMGYSFIALQGFDLIAAVGGEIREPQRTIPRAMIFSLAIALLIYLPLLFVITTVGIEPGQSIVEYEDVTHVIQSQQVTPIDAQTTHVRWQLYHIPGLSEGKLRVTQARMRDLIKQIEQDMPIWNNKLNLEKPLLVQGDGPILAYRKNYDRYFDYSDDPEPAVVAAE